MSNPTAQEISDLVDTFYAKVKELENAINDILDWIPWGFGWVADKLKEGWNWLCNKINAAFDKLAWVLSNLGSPDTLTRTADEWSSTVGSHVSARVGFADLAGLSVDDTWKGSAAEQYKQQMPLQKTALQNVKTQFTDGISTALKDLATGIKTFWTVMISALTVLVVAIITAIAAAAGIITAPTAPFAAAIGVGVFAAAAWGAVEILKSQCSSANTTLTQKLSENTAYPGAAWPRATV